jgi:hypothetical protein
MKPGDILLRKHKESSKDESMPDEVGKKKMKTNNSSSIGSSSSKYHLRSNKG